MEVILRDPLQSPFQEMGVRTGKPTDPGVGGWTPQPGDYLLNETGLFLTDESGNQLTA